MPIVRVCMTPNAFRNYTVSGPVEILFRTVYFGPKVNVGPWCNVSYAAT